MAIQKYVGFTEAELKALTITKEQWEDLKSILHGSSVESPAEAQGE
jgi:hypothetical protein